MRAKSRAQKWLVTWGRCVYMTHIQPVQLNVGSLSCTGGRELPEPCMYSLMAVCVSSGSPVRMCKIADVASACIYQRLSVMQTGSREQLHAET